MRVHLLYVAAAFLCAMIAVPFFYGHRMDDRVFMGGLLAFVGTPLIAGILQKQAYRRVTLVAAGLVLLCPVVYAITDRLAEEFEKLRDGYFLGTSSTILFVSADWLINSYRSGKSVHAFAAAFSLIAAAFSSFVLMWMVMYFE